MVLVEVSCESAVEEVSSGSMVLSVVFVGESSRIELASLVVLVLATVVGGGEEVVFCGVLVFVIALEIA